MTYAIIECINGNFYVRAEGITSHEAAKTQYHGRCQALWNAADVQTAYCMMPRAWGISYKVRRETSDRHGEGVVQREGNNLMRKRQKGNVRATVELKCILMVVVVT